MAKQAAIAAQVKSVCDLLHQYEGLEKRQLRRIQTVGFYNAFAKIILNGDAPPAGRLCIRSRSLRIHHRYCPASPPVRFSPHNMIPMR